jgi:hypothetical protein
METPDLLKIFISYSHTSPEYKQRILELAKRLADEGGLDVMFDAWSLREGQSLTSFMEAMVTDSSINKIVVCVDKIYADKADSRVGGVGTEAQIISKQVYENVGQTKFIPVVMEFVAGKACLPTFFGDRAYVDMSTPQNSVLNFEQLVRAIWDKPLYKKPEPGPKPMFMLKEESGESTELDSLIGKVELLTKNKQFDTSDEIEEVFSHFDADLKQYREMAIPHNLDEFIALLSESVVLRDSMLRFVEILIKRKLYGEYEYKIKAVFETALTYMNMDSRPPKYSDCYHIFVYEFFLYYVTLLIDRRDFSAAHRFIDASYIIQNPQARTRTAKVSSFYHHSDSLDEWKDEEDRKYIVPTATIMQKRASNQIVSFPMLMQTDTVIFIHSLMASTRWFPQTLIYFNHGDPHDIFLRANSREGMSDIAKLFGLSPEQNFCEVLRDIRNDANSKLKQISPWMDLTLNQLVGIDTICKKEHNNGI